MSKGKVGETARIVVGVLVVMGCSGLAMSLASRTFLDWRWPAAICCAISILISVLLAWPLAPQLRLTRGVVTFIFSLCLTASILPAAFYSLNYFGARESSEHTDTATVVRKYSEEHYRTRRVGRRTVGRGEKYYMYYAEVELPDSRHLDISVSVGEYLKLRPGSRVSLDIERGFFGFDVMKSKTILSK